MKAVAVFHGKALDQQLSYPIQETGGDGSQRERCSGHGRIKKGAMGLVQCETFKRCDAEPILSGARTS